MRTNSYSDRFQSQEAVEFYDSKEYSSDSYSTAIWRLERPVLEAILNDLRRERKQPVRLLDFACGTGRVLSSLEGLVGSADGIDISESMVAAARAKCVKARLRVGDILADPELCEGHYDAISCFRFLLNAEPEMRNRILGRLRDALSAPDGRLLINVHGNSRSLRHPGLVWRRWRARTENSDAPLNEMSPAETRDLLRRNGFEVVRQFGFGAVPPTLYRSPLRAAAWAIDKSLAGDRWWNDWSIEMLFLCRPC